MKKIILLAFMFIAAPASAFAQTFGDFKASYDGYQDLSCVDTAGKLIVSGHGVRFLSSGSDSLQSLMQVFESISHREYVRTDLALIANTFDGPAIVAKTRGPIRIVSAKLGPESTGDAEKAEVVFTVLMSAAIDARHSGAPSLLKCHYSHAPYDGAGGN